MAEAYLLVRIPCLDEHKEILQAELEWLGSDGIWDKGSELEVYFPQSVYNVEALYNMLSKYGMENSFHTEKVVDENWNATWEAGYEPVSVDHFAHIRATFHPAQTNFEHEIVINPQMSFGTGHHATTKLVIQMMRSIPIKDKTVLDMGSGTGILSFLAASMGASEVLGIDIDTNSVENAGENRKYNRSDNVSFIQGSSGQIPDERYDIILSNITRNINRELLPHLAAHLAGGGYLIMAGFLTFDLEDMVNRCRELGMNLVRNAHDQEWEVILVQKSN